MENKEASCQCVFNCPKVLFVVVLVVLVVVDVVVVDVVVVNVVVVLVDVDIISITRGKVARLFNTYQMYIGP